MTPAPPGPSKHLLYVADPMCSWCYGFAPVISGLARRLGASVPVHVVMGGLRPGETRAQRPEDMAYLRQAWARVGELSGQPFNDDFFARAEFVYDTEPPCRAVVTVRHVHPTEALPFLARISRAFYADNRDITDAGVLGDIAREAGLDRPEFLAAFGSDDARAATEADFAMSRDAGISGYPMLLAGSPTDGYAVVTQGFCALAEIEATVLQWAGAK